MKPCFKERSFSCFLLVISKPMFIFFVRLCSPFISFQVGPFCYAISFWKSCHFPNITCFCRGSRGVFRVFFFVICPPQNRPSFTILPYCSPCKMDIFPLLQIVSILKYLVFSAFFLHRKSLMWLQSYFSSVFCTLNVRPNIDQFWPFCHTIHSLSMKNSYFFLFP